MGTVTEHSLGLALRDYGTKDRRPEECLPQTLTPGTVNEFLKEGQRGYDVGQEMPLRRAKGEQSVSRPLASVSILESTPFEMDGKTWTKGKYKVREVYDPSDPTVYFEGCQKRRLL